MSRSYIFASMLPAVLLLAVAGGAMYGAQYVFRVTERPDIDAKEVALLEQIKAEPLEREQANHLLTVTIEHGRQGVRFQRSTAAVLGVFGFLVAGLAVWVGVGGYFAAKKSN